MNEPGIGNAAEYAGSTRDLGTLLAIDGSLATYRYGLKIGVCGMEFAGGASPCPHNASQTKMFA
jgi:hypothetical protein